MFRKQAVAAALLMVLAAPSLALAAVEKVRVRIDGLACPFCAYNIEKRVKTLDGVDKKARLNISVETGLARVPWNGRPFDLAALKKAIVEAGFTPGEVSVRAVGTASLDATKRTLRLVDGSANLAVDVKRAKRADHQAAWDSLKAVASGRKSPLRIRVEGVAEKARGKESWSLVLHRWAPLDYEAEVVVKINKLACEQCSTRTMRALRGLPGVIHAQADHEQDVVSVWTTTASPDVKPIRERIEKLGFKVASVKIHAKAKAK